MSLLATVDQVFQFCCFDTPIYKWNIDTLLLTTIMLAGSWFAVAFPLFSGQILAVLASKTIQFPFHHDLQSLDVNGYISPSLTLKSRPTTVYRHPKPSRRTHPGSNQYSEAIEWSPIEVLGPDVDDIHTLSQLARMAGNAYAQSGKKNWYSLDPAWNTVRRKRYSTNIGLTLTISELSLRLGGLYRWIP
jgi:hypothetical protein